MCLSGYPERDPAAKLASILEPAFPAPGRSWSHAVTADKLRVILRQNWSKVAALAHQIHDEKDPSDVVAEHLRHEAGITWQGSDPTPDRAVAIISALNAAGFKVVRDGE